MALNLGVYGKHTIGVDGGIRNKMGWHKVEDVGVDLGGVEVNIMKIHRTKFSEFI